jgi:hypothetical protein
MHYERMSERLWFGLKEALLLSISIQRDFLCVRIWKLVIE